MYKASKSMFRHVPHTYSSLPFAYPHSYSIHFRYASLRNCCYRSVSLQIPHTPQVTST